MDYMYEVWPEILAGYQDGVNNSQQDSATKASLEMMLNGSPIINFLLHATVFRGRKLITKNEPFTNISEISAKAATGVLDYGRCNKPHQSIFYASENLETIFSEIGAKEGEQIQVLELESKKNYFFKTTWIGARDHYRRYGEFPRLMRSHSQTALSGILEKEQALSPEQRLHYAYLDASIANIFRKKKSEWKSNSIYKFTAICSEILFEQGLNALIYPSVAHLGGWNAAILPDILDSHFSYKSCSIYSIEKALGLGIYSVKKVSETTKLNEDKTIDW